MSLTLVKRLPIDHSYNGNNQQRALVECACGKQYETGFYQIKKGKSCRSCSSKKVDPNLVSQTTFGRMKKSARARNIGVSVDLNCLNEVYASQIVNGEKFARCVYSGYPLTSKSSDDYEVSIDRIDSDEGYVEGNVQLVHKDVNIAKHSLSDSRFMFLIHQYATKSLAPVVDTEYVLGTRKNYRGVGAFTGEKVGAYRNGAKKRGLEFNLTAEGLNDLFVSQKGICALSGLGLFPESLSVDRIDNSKGYSIDNVQLVTKEMNYMRHSKTLEEFDVFMADLYVWNYIVIPNLIGRNEVVK